MALFYLIYYIEGKIKQLKVFQISIIMASSYVIKETGIWSTHKQNYDSVLNPFKIATQKIKLPLSWLQCLNTSI